MPQDIFDTIAPSSAPSGGGDIFDTVAASAPRRNPASAPMEAPDTSILGRAKEAISSGVQSAGRSLLDIYRTLDPTQANSMLEAGLAPISAAGSPSIFAGELAGETARKATEGMGPNTSAAVGTVANLLAGVLVPTSPIRARADAGRRIAGVEAQSAAARQAATQTAGIEATAQQMRRTTPALESPQVIARREQIAAMEQALTEAERLRQSPQGGRLLTEDLRRQSSTPAIELPQQPITALEAPGVADMRDRIAAIERQLSSAEDLRQSPQGGKLLVADLLQKEKAGRQAERQRVAELFQPKAPIVESPRAEIPIPKRFQITPEAQARTEATIAEAKAKPMRTPQKEVYTAAQDHIRTITDTPAELEYKGHTYTGAVKKGNNVVLKDDPDKVVRGPEQILQVEEKIPFDIPPETPKPTFQQTPAGQQATIPGAEARSVPTAPLRPKAKQTEAPLELEQPGIRAKEPGLFETDPVKVQEIRNSIADGEGILKAGKKISGAQMSEAELAAVKRSVEKSKARIEKPAVKEPWGLSREEWNDIYRARDPYKGNKPGADSIDALDADIKATGLPPGKRSLEDLRKWAEKSSTERPANPAEAYDAALASWRTESKKFTQVRDAYRKKTVGDKEYLAARAEFEKQQSIFDQAETEFIAKTNAKPTPTPEANLSAEEIAARDDMRGMLGGKKPKGKKVADILPASPPSGGGQKLADLLKSEKGSLTLPKLTNDDGTVGAARLTTGGLFEESSKTLSKTMGDEGGKLATLSKAVRNDAEIEAGIAFNRVGKGLKNLDAEQQDNLVSVLEGMAKPMDADVAATAKVAREELDKIAARAKQVKLFTKNPITGEKYPFKGKEDYFPHMFGQELGEYIKDPRSRAIVKERIREQMERGGKKAVTDTEIEHALQAMVKASRTRNNHLEISRVFDAPDYSRDPKVVLSKHFSDAYRRINIAEKFGPDLAGGEDLLSRIGQNKGDRAESFARTYFEKVTGTEKAGNQTVKEAVDFATNFNAFSKLGQAVISNLSQPVYTAVVAGAKNAAKGYRDAFTIRGKDFAEKTGAILNDTMSDFLKDAGARTDQSKMGRAADAVLKYTGFSSAERMNRTMSANTGKYFARETFDKLKAKPDNARLRETLGKMNVDVDAALKRGALNEADELKAGQSIVNRTQFKTDVTEIPLFWASDAGRLLTQFKKFQFKSGQMVKEEILKEAAKGNIKPLIRAAAILPVAGAAVLHSRDAIRFGQQREKDAGIADYLATVGTFGAFTDAFAGSGRQPVRGLSYLAGPTLGDAGAAWEAVSAITQKGDVNPMAKLAVRQIPVVGPSLRQLFSDATKKEVSPRAKLMKELGITAPTSKKKRLEEMGLSQ
jgi:hypothetical protein